MLSGSREPASTLGCRASRVATSVRRVPSDTAGRTNSLLPFGFGFPGLCCYARLLVRTTNMIMKGGRNCEQFDRLRFAAPCNAGFPTAAARAAASANACGREAARSCASRAPPSDPHGCARGPLRPSPRAAAAMPAIQGASTTSPKPACDNEPKLGLTLNGAANAGEHLVRAAR